MESSPLIKAHDHARAASTATHTADTTVAINEHARAAGEFANAANDTTSVEALRTLKLLEQHHRRLSELLQAPLQSSFSHASSENDSSSEHDSQQDEKEPRHHSSSESPAHSAKTFSEKNTPKPISLKQPRYPARDLGASIASNLASARGIRSKYRSQPLSPSVSNTEAPGNLEGTTKKAASRSRMQDMLDNSDKTNALSSPDRDPALAEDASARGNSDVPATTTSNDDSFSRFYSAFGSIINRISAPLAFAGLPLIGEDHPEEQSAPPPPEMPTQTRIRVKHASPTSASTSASTEPDLQRLYSKAALRAVAREGQSTNDSFYVVPTSGHTASYASILSFADKEKRRMEASVHPHLGNVLEHPDEDDFVDTRESLSIHSSTLKKRTGKGTNTDHMVEELSLENKSLKDMIDLLSKRLHAFESMSQNSGLRLAESMRLMRPEAGIPEDAMAREIMELKQQNQALLRQNEELHNNFAKASASLVRYRERWDQLIAGAKARRAGGAQGNSADGNGESVRSLENA